MDKREELKLGFKQLITLGLELSELAKESKKEEILGFGTKYQNWYTRALKMVEVLAKDRYAEFKSYYEIEPKRKETNAQNYVIRDFIMKIDESENFDLISLFWDKHVVTATKVYNQVQILQALETRVDSVFADIQGLLLSEIQEKELITAKELAKTNLRAAGSLTGVVLEHHLQKVMENHYLQLTKKNPTIADINDLLRNNAVYDTPAWRKIQYLGDIRNLCSHKKEREPKESEVVDLISGVNEIIKTVF